MVEDTASCGSTERVRSGAGVMMKRRAAWTCRLPLELGAEVYVILEDNTLWALRDMSAFTQDNSVLTERSDTQAAVPTEETLTSVNTNGCVAVSPSGSVYCFDEQSMSGYVQINEEDERFRPTTLLDGQFQDRTNGGTVRFGLTQQGRLVGSNGYSMDGVQSAAGNGKLLRQSTKRVSSSVRGTCMV